MTRLTEEADELLEHAEFLDSLASWNLLSSDVDLEGEDEENITPDNSNIFMLRREAKDARQKAAEIVMITTIILDHNNYNVLLNLITLEPEDRDDTAWPAFSEGRRSMLPWY